MIYEEAKKNLDAVREGRYVSSSAIRRSLWVTGDLRASKKLRSPGVVEPLQDQDWRGRVRSRQILVAASLR
jgi:hypothetical protein